MAGFFEQNPDLENGGGGGGAYISKDEKERMIQEGIPFYATAVEYQEGQGYKGANRYLVTIEIDAFSEDGEAEERLLGFTSGVESRERFLSKLSDYLDDDGAEAPELKLTRVGRSVLVVAASADVEPDAQPDDEVDEPEDAKPAPKRRAAPVKSAAKKPAPKKAAPARKPATKAPARKRTAR